MTQEPVDPQETPIEETQVEDMDEITEIKDIETLQEEINALQNDLSQIQAKADEYLDGWQRALAEFANYKKRIERDREQYYRSATGSIVKRYLEVMDDLERALKNRPQEGEGATWSDGIELIYRKLQSILEAEGVKAMGAEGKLFDPNLHEAITSEPSDEHESGEIIEVLQKGYMMGDRVLRPAVVRVAQ